jgi:hypothetical protein
MRAAAGGLALALAAGIGLAALPGPRAEAADHSEITVAWPGGNSPDLQQYQPQRDPSSIHYQDFENVRVTVSKTRDLTDEAVTVTVTGMPGASQRLPDAYDRPTELGASFVQAMQCWGDPTDPEFYKNCLWGAWVNAGADTAGRPPVPFTVNALGRGTTFPAAVDVPFRAVTGTEYSSIRAGSRGEATEYLQLFAPENTNERSEHVDSSGTSQFLFETQSGSAQPYLGCGNQDSATGTRCWLVLVPRGLHVSAARDGCSIVSASGSRANMVQQNSPINPHCDYWANRVVVPLDFRPTGSPCPPGSAERLVTGTEIIRTAFSSWQSGLCGTSGTAYALTTASDTATRAQLRAGQTGMTFTARPLAPEPPSDTASTADPVKIDVVYAPVAVCGIAIAFLANEGGVRQSEIKLTPRLIAKMVTHSYATEQMLYYYSLPDVIGPWNPYHPDGNAISSLSSDPEFRALNPGTYAPFGGSLIMTGPDAADLIAQLWTYLQADDAARDFLAGEPDNVRPGDEGNSGMTLNPFYLPKGHPDARVPAFVHGEAMLYAGGGGLVPRPALLPQQDENGILQWRSVGLTYGDGSPMCLCDAPVETFLKADDSEAPQNLPYAPDQYRYDIQQLRPYAANLSAAARMVFRGDNGSKTLWNTAKLTSVGTGAYDSNGLANMRSVFVTGFTDITSASLYGLSTASLGVPNAPGTFVNASTSGMAAALSAQRETAVEGVAITDPALLPAKAYPLTSVLYAAVNLTATDESARAEYADFIEYAVTAGQTQGSAPGELPEGYLPLTNELREQALAAVQVIRDYQPSQDEDGDPAAEDPENNQLLTNSRVTAPAPGTGTQQNPPSNGGTTPDGFGEAEDPDSSPEPPPDSALDTAYTQAEAKTEAATAGAAPPARRTLGVLLAAGLAGAVAGPLLLRRREVAP